MSEFSTPRFNRQGKSGLRFSCRSYCAYQFNLQGFVEDHDPTSTFHMFERNITETVESSREQFHGLGCCQRHSMVELSNCESLVGGDQVVITPVRKKEIKVRSGGPNDFSVVLFVEV